MIVPIFLQFFSRKFFLEYLNVEYLGISGTFTSILSTLSLSELGLQTAIVYCLYKPLKENDTSLVNKLMNVLRVVYKWIGIGFIIFPFFCIPLLGYILKDTVVDNTIRLCFLLESFGSATTYFLAYKRALLYADQKEYIAKIVDLICNLIFVSLQLYMLYRMQSYVVFCIVNCVRALTSNLIVNICCNQLFPYLHKEPISKEVFNEVWNYTKNIIVLRLAAYVYQSTDNLVLSSMINATSVGLLGNYTTLTLKLTALANGMLTPITPIIGNLLLDKDDTKNLGVFRAYTFVRFVIAALIVVVFTTVINDFIIWWIGEEYVLPSVIKYLLAADIYINLYYTACCDFNGAAGLFKDDKKIAVQGALINIISSIALVKVLGMEGVLIGTVISQSYFWVRRSYLMFSKCMAFNVKGFFYYWLHSLKDIITVLILIILSNHIYGCIVMNNVIWKVIIGSLITGIFVLLVLVLFNFKTSEFKYILNFKSKKS